MTTATVAVKQSLRELPNPLLTRDSDAVISLENVSKTHPDGFVAIEGVSFSVPTGGIFGLLGPNGAGKTTLINVICGLTPASAGRVLVGGVNPQVNPKLIRYTLGAQLQGIPFQQYVRVHELLRLFSAFYPNPLDVDQLLAFTGLGEKRRSFCTELSGGEKQRLSIARALVGDPAVLILDEPTTGLDAAMRQELLSLIEELRRKGRTVLITTHYIEEAERLCDLVAVLNRGHLQAVDSPAGLIQRYGKNESLHLRVSKAMSIEDLVKIGSASGARVEEDGPSYCLFGENAERMLQGIINGLSGSDIKLEEARVVHSGLEEAYLNLLSEERQQ